jgi:hypothetical protein
MWHHLLDNHQRGIFLGTPHEHANHSKSDVLFSLYGAENDTIVRLLINLHPFWINYIIL